ncbi:MAG: RimK family alpha-L-glutamate ligase [Candidatus Nanohaloarchaea archaeon]
MKNIGFLWDAEVEWDRDNPFGGERSKDFARYTELGRERGLKVLIAKYQWYTGGELEKAFHWDGKEWQKLRNVKLDGVYDKFKFNPETEELKQKIGEEVGILNYPELEKICKDKLETYRFFPDHVPETLKASTKNLEQILEKYGKAVFKPRYGFAGKGVEVIEKTSEFEEPERPENFVLQAFVETDGIPELGVEGPHDLRTIVVNGEIQDGNYVRVPDEGLISNISRGGDQVYVDRDELPESTVKIIEEVASEFQRFQPAIFSVDFMFDLKGRPHIVELNSKPGTYYHHPVKVEGKEVPKIENILEMLRERFE